MYKSIVSALYCLSHSLTQPVKKMAICVRVHATSHVVFVSGLFVWTLLG